MQCGEGRLSTDYTDSRRYEDGSGPVANYDSNSDVPLGVPGCDNRIAAELLYRYGYNVLNPSKSIKTYHYHPSGDSTRMYLNSDYSRNCYVEGPYEHLTPHKLDYESSSLKKKLYLSL